MAVMKHNHPWGDSNLGPLTLQSGMLRLDHCDLGITGSDCLHAGCPFCYPIKCQSTEWLFSAPDLPSFTSAFPQNRSARDVNRWLLDEM